MARLGLRFDLLSRGSRDAERDVDRLGRASGRASVGIGRLGSGLRLGFGASVGVASAGVFALGAALKGGLDEAISYQRITDQVNQTIKSTGGVAGVTVAGLKDYAGQLESISGVDEELILQSQNVLLTFTGIRNEVGKGNDVFNQASQAALDLATTLGTDVSKTAVQVGKALNDPTKGINALSKAGVSFTQQQKDQIKALQKSGNTLGAQKIILAELNKEFGGAAKAAGMGLGGSIARLKDTVSDTFRTIATAALPTLTRLADTVAKRLPGAIAAGQRVLKQIADVVKANFLPAFQTIKTFFQASLLPLFQQVLVKAQPLFNFLRDNARPILVALAAGFVVFTAPVTSLIVGLGLLYTKSSQFRDILATVGGFLQTQFTPVIRALVTAFQENLAPALRGLFQRLQDNKPQLITIGKILAGTAAVVLVVAAKIATVLIPVIGRLLQGVVAAIGVIVGIVGALVRFGGAVGSAGAAVGRFVSNVVDFVKDLPSRAGQALGELGPAITGRAVEAFRSMRRAASEQVGKVVDFLKTLPQRCVQALGDVGSVLFHAGEDLILGFVRGIASQFGAVKDKLGELTGKLTSWKGPASLDRVILHSTGQLVIDGFRAGLESRYASVKSSLAAFTKSAAQDAINSVQKALPRLQATLSAAKDKVGGLLTSRSQLRDSIRSATGLDSSSLDQAGANGFSGVLIDLQRQVGQQAEFLKNIKALQSRGVSRATINGFLSAGQGEAGDLVRTLAGATQGELGQFTSLTGLVDRRASSVATTNATSTFAAQLAVANRQAALAEQLVHRADTTIRKFEELIAELKSQPVKNASELKTAVRRT